MRVGYPLVEKPVKGRLTVRLAYAPTNRLMLAKLCENRKADLIWDRPSKTWLVARKHHRNLVAGLVRAFGVCYVIEHYLETERCFASCVNATGHECVCSCQGRNHQGGNLYAGWTEIHIPHDAGPMYQRTSATTRTFVVKA